MNLFTRKKLLGGFIGLVAAGALLALVAAAAARAPVTANAAEDVDDGHSDICTIDIDLSWVSSDLSARRQPAAAAVQ
jgi:hypothetical protein